MAVIAVRQCMHKYLTTAETASKQPGKLKFHSGLLEATPACTLAHRPAVQTVQIQVFYNQSVSFEVKSACWS